MQAYPFQFFSPAYRLIQPIVASVTFLSSTIQKDCALPWSSNNAKMHGLGFQPCLLFPRLLRFILRWSCRPSKDGRDGVDEDFVVASKEGSANSLGSKNGGQLPRMAGSPPRELVQELIEENTRLYEENQKLSASTRRKNEEKDCPLLQKADICWRERLDPYEQYKQSTGLKNLFIMPPTLAILWLRSQQWRDFWPVYGWSVCICIACASRAIVIWLSITSCIRHYRCRGLEKEIAVHDARRILNIKDLEEANQKLQGEKEKLQSGYVFCYKWLIMPPPPPPPSSPQNHATVTSLWTLAEGFE